MRTKKPRKAVPELSAAEIDKTLKKLGKLMQEQRKALASLDDFAYEIDISRSAMVRYEAGGDMLLSNFLKVLYGLGISPEELVNILK